MLRRDVNVVSVHDPELIPAALLARLIRRVPVVVDVHEDVPAQIRHKAWVPVPLRRPAAWLAHRFLRMAERWCVVTLAEPGYGRLFRREHPAFVNYPAAGSLPEPSDDEGYAVYVGDVTGQRGAISMVDAVGALERPVPLVVVGPVDDGLAKQMLDRSATKGVDLTLLGPLPHRAAMEMVAGASVGHAQSSRTRGTCTAAALRQAAALLIPPAAPSGSPGETSTTASKPRTASRVPGRSEATTGTPIARYSITFVGIDQR
jgi:hypothetical protein